MQEILDDIDQNEFENKNTYYADVSNALLKTELFLFVLVFLFYGIKFYILLLFFLALIFLLSCIGIIYGIKSFLKKENATPQKNIGLIGNIIIPIVVILLVFFFLFLIV